jgi:hypothetical protein
VKKGINSVNNSVKENEYSESIIWLKEMIKMFKNTKQKIIPMSLKILKAIFSLKV